MVRICLLQTLPLCPRMVAISTTAALLGLRCVFRKVSITRQNTLYQERKDVGESSRGKSTLFIAYHILGFPGDSDGKESACNVGDSGLILWLGRSPGEGNGNPLQYSCLEKPTGQRCLVGYSPWGHKEWATNTAVRKKPQGLGMAG